MVKVRFEHGQSPADRRSHGGRGGGDRPEGPRFTVLLTEDREHAIEHWTHQLPRLLEPQGVQAHVARSGHEAIELARQVTFHAAVIDLLTPSDEGPGGAPRRSGGSGGSGVPGGLWLLELLRRQPERPPVVLVSNPSFSQRQAQRYLNEALRLGAFSVINRPVELEALLASIRRLIDRRYQGTWPVQLDPSLGQSNEPDHAQRLRDTLNRPSSNPRPSAAQSQEETRR